MPETGIHSIISIPQDVMLARLAQSEQMREFFMRMWQQNPTLAAQAGPRVRELLAVPPAPTFTSRN
ncbi:MAG: hypothetical protein Q8L56_08060 [Rhodocyclaceae bacterium]|nr:hypothetical protein [Rhodocyclaceae bacterium]